MYICFTLLEENLQSNKILYIKTVESVEFFPKCHHTDSIFHCPSFAIKQSNLNGTKNFLRKEK